MNAFDVGSWAIFGVSVQALAQGLRHKPLNYKPIGYVLSGAGFVGVGYLMNQIRAKQRGFLDGRVSQLNKERAERGVTFQRQ